MCERDMRCTLAPGHGGSCSIFGGDYQISRKEGKVHYLWTSAKLPSGFKGVYQSKEGWTVNHVGCGKFGCDKGQGTSTRYICSVATPKDGALELAKHIEELMEQRAAAAAEHRASVMQDRDYLEALLRRVIDERVVARTASGCEGALTPLLCARAMPSSLPLVMPRAMPSSLPLARAPSLLSCARVSHLIHTRACAPLVLHHALAPDPHPRMRSPRAPPCSRT